MANHGYMVMMTLKQTSNHLSGRYQMSQSNVEVLKIFVITVILYSMNFYHRWRILFGHYMLTHVKLFIINDQIYWRTVYRNCTMIPAPVHVIAMFNQIWWEKHLLLCPPYSPDVVPYVTFPSSWIWKKKTWKDDILWPFKT